jgi:hypothetical protein
VITELAHLGQSHSTGIGEDIRPHPSVQGSLHDRVKRNKLPIGVLTLKGALAPPCASVTARVSVSEG